MVPTCEGLVGCQVAAVQQVQVAREGQVLTEAAAVHHNQLQGKFKEAAIPGLFD